MRKLVPFAYGFRPFFLLAGWYAVIAIGLWLWLYPAAPGPFATLPAQLWHGHEMLFGFVGAAIAGFMLTAVPSWTGSRGFAGLPLIALTLLWLAGRVALFAGDAIPFWLLGLAELAFLPMLALLLAPPLLRATNRNTPLLFVLLFLWSADAVFVYALAQGDPGLANTAVRAALNLVLLLVTVIGGRIVPAFTANALRGRGETPGLRASRHLDRFVIGAMVLAIPADIVWPGGSAAGLVALAAGLGQAVRLAGWQGWRTLGEPIVWVLHAAYLWLPIGLLLKAGWFLGGLPWAAYWLHALGAGAAATMILAVMTRASLGHTGRELRVSPPVTAAYLLLLAAVVVRVFGAAWLPFGYVTTVSIAGALWLLAFLVYSVAYAPVLLQPRADGKPG
ncbi:NnrS family protein [Lentisalinibacter orientalis]|uniref:NnrS family protein n=1 Tax=Lentisalinibacter orientalis TaxID=2992241 RepID=UPI0038639B1A